jgi:cysteine-rich repeat protein
MPTRGPVRRLVSAVALAAAVLTASPGAGVVPPFGGVSTTTVGGSDGPIPLPDGQGNSVIAVLDVPAGGVIVDVDVTLDLPHTQPDNLDVYLVSPAGTAVTLTTDNGAGNDDVFAPVTFDDQAPGTPSAANVRNATFTNLVPVGVVQPEEALGAVVGEPAGGAWVLVILDDAQDGQRGTLRGWTLSVSSVAAVGPSAPATFAGPGPLTISNAAGVASSVAVSGLGPRLWDVNVAIDVSHTNAADLDVFLTSPSGRRIDLVTDVGGGNDDLFLGTVFDDQMGTPIGDLQVPTSPAPFPAVVGEGALTAFLGEDPNGTWTLGVVDDTSSYNGRLNGWTLTLVTATACGDGGLDPGEQCDDGNPTSGDGCDANCTPSACGNGVVAPGEDCDDGNTIGGDACPSTCRNGETSCDDCVDNDGDGLLDAADPACEPGALGVRRATAVPGRGSLVVVADVAAPTDAAGPVALVVAAGNAPATCASLGDLQGRGRRRTAHGAIGGGSATLKLVVGRRGGRLTLRARDLDLGLAPDDATVAVGVTVGGQRFAASGAFRRRGRTKWVHP